MKVTIVCGHYLPKLGYLEVHLAQALTKLGHGVSVVTTSAVPAYVQQKISEPPRVGMQAEQGVAVYRLRPRVRAGQLVWAPRVKSTVLATAPDLVIAIGLGKVFPCRALQNSRYKLAVLLGDNSHTYANKSFVQRAIQQLVKRPVYEKGIRKADKIFSYTPETVEVIKPWVSTSAANHLKQKTVEISLGFNRDTFFYDDQLRAECRRELGVSEGETLLVSSGRLSTNKNYTPWIEAVEKLVANKESIKCLLIGVGEDPGSRAIQERIANGSAASAFIYRPFMTSQALNRHYNAADVGFWPITAISVFEAMGTGLQLVLPPSPSLRHLTTKHFAVSAEEGAVSPAIAAAAQLARKSDRAQHAAVVAHSFSYRSIAERILDSI